MKPQRGITSTLHPVHDGYENGRVQQPLAIAKQHTDGFEYR
jgi:hypothetical protein